MISEVTSGSNAPYFSECMDNPSLPKDSCWAHGWGVGGAGVSVTGERG